MKLNETKSFLRISVIYGIENTITSKWYIGSCLDMKDRFQRHRYYLLHNIHHSEKLQRSFNKYGEQAFEIHILRFLSDLDDRFEIEELFIKKYNSVENGYNILDKCKHVDGFKLNKTAKENFLKYLKSVEKSVISINRYTGEIENTFESVSSAARFYNTSSSNISRACLGVFNHIKDHVFVYTKDFDETKDYKKPNHWAKGKKKPDEWKNKIRHNKKCARIYKYDENLNLICEYFSISEAARKNNMSVDWIRYRINRHIPINGFLYSKELLQ